MERPDEFARNAAGRGRRPGRAERVKELWDNGVDSSVSLDQEPRCIWCYLHRSRGRGRQGATFRPMSTASTRKIVPAALFGDATGFPEPPPKEFKKQPAVRRSRRLDARRAARHRRERLHARDGDGRLARDGGGLRFYFFACASSHDLVASVSILSKLPSVVISVMAWPNLSASAVQGDFLEKATNISAVSSA